MAQRKNGRGLREITAEAYAKILKYALKKRAPITQAEAAEIGGWKKSTYHHLRKLADAGLLEYRGYNKWEISRRALSKGARGIDSKVQQFSP